MFWIGQLIALVAGLLSIEFARRIVKSNYLDLKETYFDIALMLFLIVGLLISSWDHLGSEREVTTLQTQLDTIRNYTEVSKLNFVGKTGTVTPPLLEETGVSRMLAGTYTITENHSRYICDQTAIEKFHEVISRYPSFPFSYYALAFCLTRREDSSWRGFAIKAVEILQRTITIDGHHPNHDQALRELRELLHS